MTARILALALLWPAVAVGQVTTQLSHGQSFSEIYLAQSFPQATNTHVVYVQDATTNNAHELWSVAGSGTSAQAEKKAPGDPSILDDDDSVPF